MWKRIKKNWSQVRPLIQITAISAAWLTALSRVVDYVHRETDVLAGAILGILVAIGFAYYIGKGYFKINKSEIDFDDIYN